MNGIDTHQHKFQPTRREIFSFKKRILSVIRKNPGATRSLIAAHTGETLKRVSNALDHMAKTGLVHGKIPRGGKAMVYKTTRSSFKELNEQYFRGMSPTNLREDRISSPSTDPANPYLLEPAEAAKVLRKSGILTADDHDTTDVEVVTKAVELTIAGAKVTMTMESIMKLQDKLKAVLEPDSMDALVSTMHPDVAKKLYKKLKAITGV